MKRLATLIISLVLPFAAGLIGSLATTPAIPTWYVSLTKPAFSPPNWIFGPVWTTLYLLMGIALYRVWVQGWNKRPVRQAVILFLIHLALNAVWSIVFFGLQSPGTALAVIVVLLIMIALIIWQFYRLDRVAAYVLVPYLAWVAFATALNTAIWYLN